MPKRKSDKKQQDNITMTDEAAAQLEQVFLAGLGALSNAQKAGSSAFESLIEKGKAFRNEAASDADELIDDVRDAVKSVAGDAQQKAGGLVSHMRSTPQLEKLQHVFDARVTATLERLGVASRQSIDELNEKLDNVLAAVENREAKKETPKRKSRKRKTAKRKTAKKKVGKAKPKKATTPKKRASTKRKTTKRNTSKKA